MLTNTLVLYLRVYTENIGPCAIVLFLFSYVHTYAVSLYVVPMPLSLYASVIALRKHGGNT